MDCRPDNDVGDDVERLYQRRKKRPPGLIPARHEPEVGATMLAEKQLRPRQEMSLNFCKFFIILFSFTAVSYCTVLYCVVLYGTVVYSVLYVFIVCCHLA